MFSRWNSGRVRLSLSVVCHLPSPPRLSLRGVWITGFTVLSMQPVDFGFIQPLQLVADLSQQVFPPRNVRVGFDTQR